MISSEMTVREVAALLPESTRLFETLKIDYCCGGNRPLMEACASAGVEVDNVMAQLSALDRCEAIDRADFQKRSLTELITHILETHHVFTKSEMSRIQALAEKVIGAHGANHPELLTVGELFQRLCADLNPHMFKEEQVLFPFIVAMDRAETRHEPVPFAPFGTVRNPIRMMMMEHDTAGDILRKLRAVTADYRVPSDGCISYQTLYQALEGFEKDLHQHIHLENNVLFPKSGGVGRSLKSITDKIYRPFFLAGIATVLTLGCMWGAINLLTIGLKKSFSSIEYSWVLAHGHAMVFGFVGLFIMGFAYQAFPRFKQTRLWRPRLAFSALRLMIVGIALQTIAHLLSPPSLSLEIVAAAFQLISIVVFSVAITMTIRTANKRENYDRFVYAALGWFLLAAIANPIIFKLFELPGNRAELLFNVATYNIPYRDVQLLGLAVVMILGVSLRFLPHAYGMREPSRAWQAFLFWGLNGSILIGIVLFIAGMTGGNHWLLMMQWLTTVTLLVIAIVTPFQYRLFGTVPESERDRSLKFIRAAYVWFIVATAMLVFTPIYNFGIYMPVTGSHVPFSHAFFGAYRHALTVGFIMMMIVGVSSKVMPTLSGIDVRRTRSLWPTFLLLNLGNLTRVSFQIATDFSPAAYKVMGISGFIEVVGLVLWGYELYGNMNRRRLPQKDTRSAQAIYGTFERAINR